MSRRQIVLIVYRKTYKYCSYKNQSTIVNKKTHNQYYYCTKLLMKTKKKSKLNNLNRV